MAITDWPELERPREKLLSTGAASLSDAELLAIFFRTGRMGKTAVDIARDALLHFGGLNALVSASKEEFCALAGLGLTKYSQVQAAIELGQRSLKEELLNGDCIDSSSKTKQYLTARLRNRPQEVFACLFLNNLHQVIAYEELFTGSINGATVYAREVVKAALRYNSAGVILAHNHPSGSDDPSEEDIDLTFRLRDALGLVDISVLDHIIVAGNQAISLAEESYI